MLKVQYLKHSNMDGYLYDRKLAAYGRIPWNDEVSRYSAKIFYAELFLGMKPNYNDLPSEFFGLGKVDYVNVKALSMMQSCLTLSHHWLFGLFMSKIFGQRWMPLLKLVENQWMPSLKMFKVDWVELMFV